MVDFPEMPGQGSAPSEWGPDLASRFENQEALARGRVHQTIQKAQEQFKATYERSYEGIEVQWKWVGEKIPDKNFQKNFEKDQLVYEVASSILKVSNCKKEINNTIKKSEGSGSTEGRELNKIMQYKSAEMDAELDHYFGLLNKAKKEGVDLKKDITLLPGLTDKEIKAKAHEV